MSNDPAMRPWTTPGILGVSRYICPFECGWFHDEPPIAAFADPDPALTNLDAMIASSTTKTLKRHMLAIEAVLAEHLRDHDHAPACFTRGEA